MGSWGLRSYIAFVFDKTIAYGALAAPVAVLLFLYVTALAVLLGAELNATLDLKREEFAREDRARIQREAGVTLLASARKPAPVSFEKTQGNFEQSPG